MTTVKYRGYGAMLYAAWHRALRGMNLFAARYYAVLCTALWIM